MVAAISLVPQVYVDFQAQPALLPGLTADTVACTGLANRGPINKPRYCRSLRDFQTTFGGESPSVADPTQPLSLWKGAVAMDSQGVQNKLFNRVAGATAKTSYVHLMSSTNPIVALRASSPGTWAANLSYVVSNVTATTFDLTISNAATGETDRLPKLPFGDNAALITAINQLATLVVASQPVGDVPSAVPTHTASTSGGSLPPGVYKVIGVYTNAAGRTSGSPETAVTVGGSGTGSIALGLAALPAWATGTRWYMTGTDGASGSEVYIGQSATNLFTATAVPTATEQPPTDNTALTGAGVTTAPTAGTFSFPTVNAAWAANQGNGDNGEPGVGSSLPSSLYIGAAGTPSTGLYALAAVSPTPREVFVADGAIAGDTSTWATQAQIAADNNWIAVVSIARGTTIDAALTLLATSPVTNLRASATGNRIKIGYVGLLVQDSYFNQLVAYGPAGFLAAITAAQDPNTSAGLKALANVNSAEYDLAISQAEQLIAAGANPVLTIGGVGLCFARDLMLDGTEGFKIRMDSLLRDAFLQIGVDYLQVPNTPERRQSLQDRVTTYLDGLAGDGLIPANAAATATTAATAPQTTGTASKTGPVPSTVTTATPTQRNYAAVCDDSNNVKDGTALPEIICDVQVNYFNNPVGTRFRVETGTNVDVTIQPTA